MCESYRMKCACGENHAEIFFGKMLLNERALKHLYCPRCSTGVRRAREGCLYRNFRCLVVSPAAPRYQ